MALGDFHSLLPHKAMGVVLRRCNGGIGQFAAVVALEVCCGGILGADDTVS